MSSEGGLHRKFWGLHAQHGARSLCAFWIRFLDGMPSLKAEIRQALRKEFGKNWWKVNPVIKKARWEKAAIALGSSTLSPIVADTVDVTEACGKKYKV